MAGRGTTGTRSGETALAMPACCDGATGLPRRKGREESGLQGAKQEEAAIGAVLKVWLRVWAERRHEARDTVTLKGRNQGR